MDPQASSTIRSVLLGLGGYIVGKGWIDQPTMISLLGVIMWAIPAVWALLAHRKTSLIADVKGMPDVKGVVTTSAIANSPQFKDDPKVVSSGAAVML